MNQRNFKKMVAEMPIKNDKLEVNFFMVDDDSEYQEVASIIDDLTFHKWEHNKESMVETVSFLFYVGYKNYGL